MRTSFYALATTLALGALTSVRAHEGDPSQYNYRDDVRPIFVEHCSGCHRPGGAGPMSLLSYSEAVPWANAIKMQILEEHMPPWLPADGVGEFRHERTLSAEEIDIIVDWVVGQTPEGEPLTSQEVAIDPAPAWSLGTPDLVLAPASEVVIGTDDYELTHCMVLPTGLTRARVASDFEIDPGLPTVVRRATISLGSSCTGARPLATWLPGQGSAALAGARGQELPAGADLAVEIRYVKGWGDEGKRLTDRSRVGIWFSDAATPVEAVRVAEARHRFDATIDLLALYPDSEPNEPLRIDAVTPSGEVQPILVIEDFRALWREKYRLEKPLRLPAGSELRLSQPAVWLDFIEVDPATAE